jgi:hypothetical protein
MSKHREFSCYPEKTPYNTNTGFISQSRQLVQTGKAGVA